MADVLCIYRKVKLLKKDAAARGSRLSLLRNLELCG